MTAMSQVGNNLRAISKDTRIALLAGPKTLQSLGPVARHLLLKSNASTIAITPS